MTNDDSSDYSHRLQRGLTAAHFRSSALALGFAAASAVAAASFLGSESAFPLVPIVAAAGLASLLFSARLFRRGAADLADPLDRCERVLDAMASGDLPESTSQLECGGLENLTEAVAGLLHRLHGLDTEVHSGTSRLRVLLADLSPLAQREAHAILDGIRELAPTAVVTAQQPVKCWLMDDEAAPLPTPIQALSQSNVSALDLLRLDALDGALEAGPAWELRTTPEDALVTV